MAFYRHSKLLPASFSNQSCDDVFPFPPTGTSTCVAHSDPHFTTFDKKKYDFMGNCTYLMSKPCNTTSVPHYEVYVTNKNRQNNYKISYVDSVHVRVKGLTVSLLRGGAVQVRRKQRIGKFSGNSKQSEK